jgi:rhodanese-related sulfurtransferase
LIELAVEQFFIFLQKSPMNLVLFGLAITSGGMLLFPLLTRGIRPGAEVSPGEAVMLINRKDALVLDVREESEFAGGHINNARHVSEKQLEERVKELEKFKAKPVIVSCAVGRRSAAVADALRKRGFTDVVALRGGIAAWQQAGMPLEK